MILIDLLHRPTPFAARVGHPLPRRAAASPRKATRRSDVMSRRGQRNNSLSPPPLPPTHRPLIPIFVPCNRPRRRASTGVQQQFVTQKLLPGEKKQTSRGEGRESARTERDQRENRKNHRILNVKGGKGEESVTIRRKISAKLE